MPTASYRTTLEDDVLRFKYACQRLGYEIAKSLYPWMIDKSTGELSITKESGKLSINDK